MSFNRFFSQIFCLCFLYTCTSPSQSATPSSTKRILIFHKTNGYRHASIDAGIAMFEELGNEDGDWETDNSDDSSVFTDVNLAQYDVLVFLNTSGDGLLSNSEKLAFENFITSDKGFIGIHAATDTYRDKSWPFYNELVGGIVQVSPNHTANNFNADLEVVTSHPTVDFLGAVGSIWNKDEEYYYWELNGGQLSADNIILLEVESTGLESYDAPRPTTWYKESITYDHDNNSGTSDITLSGIKSFYTSLGHNDSDYSSDSNFRSMLKNAVTWAMDNGNSLGLVDEKFNMLKIITNPVKDNLKISFNNIDTNSNASLKIFNSLGKHIISKTLSSEHMKNEFYELGLSNYNNGLYFLVISTPYKSESFKLLKI